MSLDDSRQARRGKASIELIEVSKHYKTSGHRKVVLDNVSCKFEAGYSYGILGVNGAGKSTLLRMIAGSEQPTAGKVKRNVNVSWPIGLMGGFSPLQSIRSNITFLARAYGEDPRRVMDFIEDFTELGDYLDARHGALSSGMAAKLGFGVSMAIQFELYLSDEATAVGDTRFVKKCERAFEDRRAHADLLIVSHQVGTIKSFCDRGAVLVDGVLMMFDNVDNAIDIYNRLNR